MSFSEFLKAAGAAQRVEAEYAGDPAIVAAVMRAVLDDAVAELGGDAEVSLVSVTLDQLSSNDEGHDVAFETRLDRQTRTLIFMSGMARAGELGLLKATAIYRVG